MCSSSSSSDECDDDNHRGIGASGGESAGSGTGNCHSKYRRHRSKRIGDKDGSLAVPTASGSPSEKSGQKLVRRRRRRSLNGTSPAPPKPEIRPAERLSAFLGDADGEDEGADRDSPEHIYQRIDEFDDFDVEKKSAVGEKLYRAVPASASELTAPTSTSDSSRLFFPKERTDAPEVGGSRAYVTNHQPTRVPRQYSLPKGSTFVSCVQFSINLPLLLRCIDGKCIGGIPDPPP